MALLHTTSGIASARAGGFGRLLAAGGGDPSFASVTALLHVNNAVTDNSPLANTWAIGGTGSFSTTQVKYGSHSVFINGTGGAGNGGAFATTATNVMDFNTGDFTIEWWEYCNSFSDQSTRFDGRNAAASVGNIYAYKATTSSTSALAFASLSFSGYTWTTGSWVHMAVVRASSNTSFYANGNRIGSAQADSTNYTTGGCTFGANTGGPNFGLVGYMDDMRVTKTARYTGSTYTIPTAEFPNS